MSLFIASPSGDLILGALIAMLGVLDGMILTRMPSRSTVNKSAKIAAARELAMATMLSLEEFIGDCFAAAHDDPEFNPDDPEEFLFNTADPAPILPRNADWTLLSPAIADEIRWMPVRARNIVDGLQALDISTPNYGDLFERRQHDFSKLGVKALDLIGRLGRQYGIATPDRPEYYQPMDAFAAKIADIQGRWSRRLKVVDSSGESVSNVTPLFVVSREDAPHR